MAKEYVLTLTAANRVGILAAVSNAIAELGGDMQEISVTVMRKFFTIILSAEFPDGRDPEIIVDHVRDVGRPYQLTVQLNDPATESSGEDAPREETRTHFLVVAGKNEPGMMRQVSSRLAQEGVDISDLYAVRDVHDGMFRIWLELNVPTAVDPTELADAIERLNEGGQLTARLYTAEEFGKTGEQQPLRTRI